MGADGCGRLLQVNIRIGQRWNVSVRVVNFRLFHVDFTRKKNPDVYCRAEGGATYCRLYLFLSCTRFALWRLDYYYCITFFFPTLVFSVTLCQSSVFFMGSLLYRIRNSDLYFRTAGGYDYSAFCTILLSVLFIRGAVVLSPLREEYLYRVTSALNVCETLNDKFPVLSVAETGGVDRRCCCCHTAAFWAKKIQVILVYRIIWRQAASKIATTTKSRTMEHNPKP